MLVEASRQIRICNEELAERHGIRAALVEKLLAHFLIDRLVGYENAPKSLLEGCTGAIIGVGM